MNAARIIAAVCLTILSLTSIAQIDDGLRAYYSFDNCDGTDETGNGSDGTLFGGVGCECGVQGQALSFDGVDDYAVFFGFVNTYFDDDDFTMSFYFKSYANSFQRSLISKKASCSSDSNIDVKLQNSLRRVNSELSVSDTEKAVTTADLDILNCWHHVALTRKNTVFRSYINGNLLDQVSSSSILDIDNAAILSISNSPCLGIDGTRRFHGLIDELRVYNRALDQTEIRNLYFSPDKIVNRDTLVFLGNSVDIFTTPTCATDFNWMPSNGVSDSFSAETTITPDSTQTYTLEFIDQNGCVAQDTILITVVDPTTLGCTEILLPSAFTPNGDGLNDLFHISNPFAISELLSFEIFDRRGGRVFATNEPFEGWDGSFKGTTLNPGVFVYQVRFVCDNVERLQTGSLSLLK